ncbi:hypothetical protein ACFQFH_11175 [Halobaculum halobium]|uniref:DUF8048 domain-containing protein n=1 Tax=Halobaculum halobium TaxID=3032281 RepID=A0ABD5TAX7_9EURY|nr:hypothetical protein [Halobaculum sp. SYNS20]
MPGRDRDSAGDSERNADRDGADDPSYDPERRELGHPIDSNALMIAAATASVGPGRLPELLRVADEHLRERREEYDRSYECVDDAHHADATDDAGGVDDAGTTTYLVPDGHWGEVGDDLGLNRREADALRRAHEQHLLRLGTKRRRRREFESALELREAVVIGG